MKTKLLAPLLILSVLLANIGIAKDISSISFFKALVGKWEGKGDIKVVSTGVNSTWITKDTCYYSKDKKMFIVESITTADGKVTKAKWKYQFNDKSKLIGVFESNGTSRTFDVKIDKDGKGFTLTQQRISKLTYYQQASGKLNGNKMTSQINILTPNGITYAVCKSVIKKKN